MRLCGLHAVHKGTVLHRVHRKDRDAIFFGPCGTIPEYRFDDPQGEYKILYAAFNLVTSFGEVLVRSPLEPDVAASEVNRRCRTELRLAREVQLYPLIDERVSGIGLSFTDLHSDDYEKCWGTSRLIWRETAADGLLYTSRFSNRLCVALFDRAADAVELHMTVSRPIMPEEAEKLCEEYGKTYIQD